MNVVAEWSLLEGFVNNLFAELTGANGGSGSAIFATIRSQQGQRDAIEAVMQTNLTDQNEREIVNCALTIYEKASKLRNRICHWIWGYCEQLPDAVLLGDPVAMTAYASAITKYSKSFSGSSTLPRFPDLDRNRIYAYKQQDFDEASERIQKAMWVVARTRNALSYTGDQRAEEFRQLSNEPEIRTELERLNKGRRNDP